MTKDSNSKDELSSVFQANIVNEKGEEVPITESMVEESMAEAKLQSIGTHTGYNKAITDEMLRKAQEKK
ncbi:hypothetical protein NBRC116493_21810 [Aurantivibrio infirmus]